MLVTASLRKVLHLMFDRAVAAAVIAGVQGPAGPGAAPSQAPSPKSRPCDCAEKQP